MTLNSGLAGIAIVALALSGCQMADHEPAEDQFSAYKLAEPTTDTVTVCHGYNCRYKSQIQISAADFKDIEKIFAQAGATPVGERKAIADTIGYLERIAGKLVGTANNPGGALNSEFVGDPSRQDCVDEATTATGYMVMLQKRGLLAFHTVVKPKVRGVFIDGRWQHFAAVIKETATEKAFAVDSWFRPNGQPAVVMTLSDWMNDFEGSDTKQLPNTG